MGRRVDGRPRGESSFFFGCELGMNCLRYGLRDFALQGKDVFEVAIVTLSPDVGI